MSRENVEHFCVRSCTRRLYANMSTVYCIFLILFFVSITFAAQTQNQEAGRCNIPPDAPKRVEEIINVCQEEIKLQILQEALSALQLTGSEHQRSKRSAFSKEDKRIAGCLLQCVYRKINAVNEKGFPTTEGLVALYTTGVEDKGYKLATYQGVHNCLKQAQKKYIVSPQSLEEPGKTCDIAYDVFDCIAEEVGKYCGQTP